MCIDIDTKGNKIIKSICYNQDFDLFNMVGKLRNNENFKFMNNFQFGKFLMRYVENFKETLEESDKIRSAIDNLFKNTRSFFRKQILVFVYLFTTPFMIHLFASLDKEGDQIILNFGLIGWSCMFGIELIAMRVEGFITYFKNLWNVNDLISLVYPIYVGMINTTSCVQSLPNMHHAKHYLQDSIHLTEEAKSMILMRVVIVFYILVKTLYFLKVDDSFGLMTTLLLGVFKGVVPFLVIFFLLVIFFAVMAAILGAN